MTKTLRIFLLLTVVAGLAVGFTPGRAVAQPSSGLGEYQPVRGFQRIAYALADNLEHHLVRHVDRAKTILFTSFVELDQLNTSSTFGRLLGEQVASRFSQHGYTVVELKLRQHSMIISEDTGELVLSRNLRDIRTDQDAQAIIVGTYTLLKDSIILGVKLISTLDGSLLSTHDATVWLTPQLRELVARNVTTFEPQRISEEPESTPEKDVSKITVPEGPLARGTVLLDLKNSLAVRLVQARLADLQYYTDRIDGIWGKNSRAALSQFKRDQGLEEPGTWDVQTQRALFRGTGQ
jgi:TolB-like protein